DVTGAWDVVFKDEKGETAARGEFERKGRALLGTFLTPTGDYRYLEGDYGDGVLRLSCFDGGHAFLFVARAQADGSLAGDFWSRTASHETWRATRARGTDSAMPDSFGMTSLKNPSGRLRFRFPDLDGHPVSLADARFQGKVVLVDLFGSWCPNCNDQAPVLAGLYRTYRDRGLEIVGLAYEMTGDPARDAVYVRKYAERHGITYPLLLAGTSDKSEASETLPDLSGVLAFPTLVFVARDGSVKAIHTGFEGPGTGAHFTDLKAKYVATIERLLDAP
ncbi:MAG TPA: TlpA disulfide reductase family protein, partial [Candidatus Polarisedimenticolia bacterium]|nr:TlpA disulfide reductase family protein [Candidatus Polarisedimenticolia bacterium]